MNEKFREMRNTINYMKKKGGWHTEDTTWTENAWDLVLFDKYKTKQISLNEFIKESINSLITKYDKNNKKPSFDGSIVPTWYDGENINDYKIKLIEWFVRTILFPDNYLWYDSPDRGKIILPICDYVWTDEAVYTYNEIIAYCGATE